MHSGPFILLYVDLGGCQQVKKVPGESEALERADSQLSQSHNSNFPVTRAQPFKTFGSPTALHIELSVPGTHTAVMLEGVVSLSHIRSIILFHWFLTHLLLFSSLFCFKPFFPGLQGCTFPRTSDCTSVHTPKKNLFPAHTHLFKAVATHLPVSSALNVTS